MKYAKFAFVMGLTFTLGKYIGETVVDVVDRAAVAALKVGGRQGNKCAQTICKTMGH